LVVVDRATAGVLVDHATAAAGALVDDALPPATLVIDRAAGGVLDDDAPKDVVPTEQAELVLVGPLCRAPFALSNEVTSDESCGCWCPVDAEWLLLSVAALDSVDDPVPVLISLPGGRGMQLAR